MRTATAIAMALLFGWLWRVAVIALVEDRWELAFLGLVWVAVGLAVAGIGGVLGWKLGGSIEARRLEKRLAQLDVELTTDAEEGPP